MIRLRAAEPAADCRLRCFLHAILCVTLHAILCVTLHAILRVTLHAILCVTLHVVLRVTLYVILLLLCMLFCSTDFLESPVDPRKINGTLSL